MRSGNPKRGCVGLEWKQLVPFDMKVDEVPDWISKLITGRPVPRIREFMKAHPEVQVVGAHMKLEFYEKLAD